MRAGPLVFVAGCTSTGAGGSFVAGDAGDAGEQARRALANVASALARAGTPIDRVVQTRMYVLDIADWEVVGRAHGEVFGAIRQNPDEWRDATAGSYTAMYIGIGALLIIIILLIVFVI